MVRTDRFAYGFLLLMMTAFMGCLRVPPAQVAFAGEKAGASDAPMFGGSPQRNMVNLLDKNIPTTWKIEDGSRKNIKWTVPLGNHAYGGPVVAGGKIYVGTNQKGEFAYEKAVLMALNEADGKFLWKITHDYPADKLFNMAREVGLCSTPVVEGNRVYYTTPGCEVVCADTSGKVQWTYDMMKELNVVPFHCGICSPLIVGDLVMVVSGNGTDEQGDIPSPKAPSFVAVNKKTGKLAWSSNLPGDRIIGGQWSNPTVAVVNGKPQVIFPGGDAVLYSFEPETGKLLWKCDCNPTRVKGGNNNYFVSTPVVVGDRLYVGMGFGPDSGASTKYSYFLCVDMTRKGDVSFKSYDAKAAANKGSALVWSFGGPVDPPPEKGRRYKFTCTISTAAVHDGLVFIPEETGYLHCLDAKTGQHYWDHDFKASTWSSPYYVDGKIYIGTDDAEVFVFEASKTKKVLATNEMDGAVQTAPVVANRVLYLMTRSKLYAIANGK